MEYVANYADFFQTGCLSGAASMAWGETPSIEGVGTSLTSAQHDMVDDAGRRFRRKSGMATRQGRAA